MNANCKSAGIAGCALAAALSVASRAADAPASAGRGVWQKHQYSFAYLGFTSTYSCDGLADKLKVLLIAAGARSDVKVIPGACASGFGRPDKFARADLTFYTLAPAGGDNTPPGADTAADSKPVAATWRPVSFSTRSPRDLQTGDCELIEQFRTNVLPMFTTHNIVNQTTCIPHQLSGSNIGLRFDSLAAVPGGPRTAPAPAAGT